MIIDADLALCVVDNNVLTAQAETTVATHISDNVVDLTKYPRNIIDQLYFVFQCEVVPISAGGGDFTIKVVTSAAVGLSTPTIMWSSGVLANADIVAWVANTTIFAFKIPAQFALRYLGATYEIVNHVFTAGSWKAFFTPDAPYLIAATP
jgi:hypothetical protein